MPNAHFALPKLNFAAKQVMEIDPPEEDDSRKSEALRNLTKKSVLITSIAKLSGSARGLPSQEDFHFYNNFQEFKDPVEEICRKSDALLRKIEASEDLFGKPVAFLDDRNTELDDDVAYDCLEKVNDEILEGFDSSLDEFKSLERKEEESDLRMMRVNKDEADNGFQMVCGETNKKMLCLEGNVEKGAVKGVPEVKVAAEVKRKIPFHVPTLPRPQDEYKIAVNNSNEPFEHVWLRRSEDGSRFIHPLEKLSVLDFIDKSVSSAEPVKPPPIELTPFKLVEEVKDLKQLAVKLRGVDEFAVDLEHNQYRSFQGLTCLLQISTRTEDFVIDTLKLRLQIGPHLREVFKDPTKRKVIHGADHDILWLQRDFGIYVCNMFDTGQASRVLKLERYSLEYLLRHFCGVAANKEYQNADWRIRPLPPEMIKYSREDTHYLLYICDLMRKRLLSSSVESESSDPPLVEAYKRSYNICIQLYEKELLTDSSYLLIYGLRDADFNAQQLAVVSGLIKWRDVVARAEDESTGYVLPNRTLVEIAKWMPLTISNMRRLLKSKHSYIERNIDRVVSIIRHSVKNAAAFEEAVKYLRERRLEMATKENNLDTEESGVLPHKACKALKIDDTSSENAVGQCKKESRNMGSSMAKVGTDKRAIATAQVLKKPSQAFGVLLGNSAKRQFEPDKRKHENTKLKQIKSSSVPLRTVSDRKQPLQSVVKKSAQMLETSSCKETVSAPATCSTLENIIVLDDNSDEEESRRGNSSSPSNDELMRLEKSIADFAAELDEDDEDESM